MCGVQRTLGAAASAGQLAARQQSMEALRAQE